MQRDDDIHRSALLLVTDTPISLVPFADYLRLRGLSVLILNNGQEAMRYAREKRADLMLSDVFLPGMDGFEQLCQFAGDDQRTFAEHSGKVGDGFENAVGRFVENQRARVIA